MEKYGFVYLWYDKKHKRFYIGCRWGTENDGYICSSTWMRQGHNHRPHDFKRRILSRVYTNKKDLLEEEYKWLSKIKNEELGKKYYNLHNHHFGHWSTTTEKDEIIKRCKPKTRPILTPEQLAARGKQISESKQRKREERIALGLPVRQKEKAPRLPRGPQSEEVKRKKSETMKRKINSGEWKPWSTGMTLGPRSEETKEKIRKAVTGKTRTDEQKQIISEGNKQAWSSGKYANRKSNNMKDFIWVRHISDGTVSRIKKDTFDPTKYLTGRKV